MYNNKKHNVDTDVNKTDKVCILQVCQDCPNLLIYQEKNAACKGYQLFTNEWKYVKY